MNPRLVGSNVIKMHSSDITVWISDSNSTTSNKPMNKSNRNYQNVYIIMLIAFIIGIAVGILIPSIVCNSNTRQERYSVGDDGERSSLSVALEANRTIDIGGGGSGGTAETNQTNSFAAVKFVEDDGIIEEGVYWGKKVESNLPKGYTTIDNDQWVKYVERSAAARLEPGCGRMQNRLVVFHDGTKGCVRYRQNLDQIQGELFSFYLAQILQLTNLAPSTISVVDLQTTTWKNLPAEIASAQWSSHRPVVVTQFIPDLGTANIPQGFRPPDKHLNQKYILDRNLTSVDYTELAQWSDLIIFDYLTANLDRVVNNLYNRQWNVNIMEAPAHNLARNSDNLLVFLDNESGLLHGYRLLHKYEPYHSLLLENLCIFRRKTIQIIERLKKDKNIGALLLQMFEANTTAKIRDFLPSLPDKSVKILNERLERVYAHVTRCRRIVSQGL